MTKETLQKISFSEYPFMINSGRGFLRGKRGHNEPKGTLFTIDTDSLASRLNVTKKKREKILFSKKM